MLSVKNLTKIYSNGTTSVTALNNVSFTLEDKGFVFITGKSGCGKTTLLSIIGGLDNATEGTVVCDGNNLSHFSNKDFDNYRNTYLGFIFQDYCLIDDLNVYQNIELSLTLKGEVLSQTEKDELIDEALASVDLDAQIKNRYIKELSGGQKQRIAIARALIKNPKLILADEPTGNLDSRTSKKILKLLKKLSKDRLVLIVSHNLDDARTYADRIIEFADGEIVSDIHRSQENTEEMSIINGTLMLPHSGDLTPAQIKEINLQLQDNKIKKIKQHTSGFEKTKNITESHNKVNIEPKRMKFKNSLKLSKFFIKKRWFASFVTIFVVSLLVFVLGLAQFLIQFQEYETILEVMQQAGETDLLIYKGYYNDDGELKTDNFVKFSNNEIQEFKDAGYNGNIYKLYYDTFCISATNTEQGNVADVWKNFSGKWIRESFGTLNCDLTYLINKFGKNGELSIIAGTLNDHPEGLIITDYMADCLVNVVGKGQTTYEDYVGKIVQNRNYINAIIDTDYEEKYQDMFDYIEDISIGIDRSADKDYFKTRTMDFISEIQKYYGIAYSINPNFANDINKTETNYTKLHYSSFEAEGFALSQDYNYIYKGFDFLEDNEIGIEFDIFNTKFGRFFGYYNEDTLDTYEPITITINKYDDSEHTNLVYTTDVIIKLLPTSYSSSNNANSSTMFAGEGIYELINNNSKYVHGLYLDDANQLGSIYSTITEKPYIVQSKIFSSISVVGDIVSVFEEFFWIIFLGIAGVCLVLLISYAYGNIKKKYYEIGVLKALGATTRNVGFLFSLQTILAGILICILSNTALLTLCTPINITISEKLLEFVANNNLGPLSILQVNLPTIIANTAVILFVTILTCFIPMAKLHKIKPKNIIANRD